VVTGEMHLVRREVYEKLDRPYYFTYHANGTVVYSEDFVFSQHCKALGYKLYTHYGVMCKHYKHLDIKAMNDLLIAQEQAWREKTGGRGRRKNF